MTLQVTPEDLGPMTVRAQIDAAGVRIELFAPGDAGREAIRGILPELRKELADAGFGASLDVSEHSGPGSAARDGTGQDGTGGTTGRRAGLRLRRRVTATARAINAPATAGTPWPTARPCATPGS